jgi:hypothetical protein
MKKSIYAALFTIACVFLSACKKDSNTSVGCSDGSSNFPHLAVGHKIDYYISDILGADDTISFNITTNPSPGAYFVHSTSKNGSGSAYAIDIYWHACGRDYYSSTDGNFNQEGHWWLSLDANVGDSWTRTLSGSTYNYHLFSKNATVMTSGLGQTFTNCYKFSYNKTGDFNVDTIYFKPEIGIVDYEGLVASYEFIGKNF